MLQATSNPDDMESRDNENTLLQNVAHQSVLEELHGLIGYIWFALVKPEWNVKQNSHWEIGFSVQSAELWQQNFAHLDSCDSSGNWKMDVDRDI